jgi:FdhE protein
MSQRILMPGEIEKLGSVTIPELLLPNPLTVFAARAERLASLAADHPMQGYLQLFSQVARIQHELVLENGLAEVVLPSAGQIDQAQEFLMPPLAVATWPRDPAWQLAARGLARRLLDETSTVHREANAQLDQANTALPGANVALPEAARVLLQKITDATPAWLEKQASEILNGLDVELDRGAAPFIAAGLQVYWTSMVSRLGLSAFVRLEHQSVCPCCGSRPTASVVRLGAPSGHRYLHCSLCAAEWHLVRIKCSQCDTTEGIEYLHVADKYPAVRAECCSACSSYLKIFYQDKDQAVDPIADDLGSLALDLMMSETTDKQRSGVNFALFQGEG